MQPSQTELSIAADLDSLLRISQHYGLEDELEQVKDRIRDHERGLMVLVAGEGNFGKSSLINALAGKPVARVAIVPTTFKVDIYNHSPDEREYAIVRRTGEDVGTRMSIARAESLCDEEEEKLKRALRSETSYCPTIIEVEWFYTDLKFGSELCLVDTPGLAQLLLNAGAVPERLVKCFDVTYFVEDVWEMWYHRADIVLWCFQANMLQAVETHRSLGVLRTKYRKVILPVITKADLVPDSAWHEVRAEFQDLYSEILGKSDIDLYFTICRNFRKPGADFGRVLSSLLRMAPAARQRKSAATAQFIVDLSRHLEGVLCSSSEQVIRNLQIVTDTVDETALEAMTTLGRTMRRIEGEADQFFASKIAGLEMELLSLYSQVKPLIGRLSRAGLQSIAEQRLQKYLEQGWLNRKLNSELNRAGVSIRAYAAAISKTKTLERARISSRLRVTRDRFSIDLKIPRSKLSADLRIPPIEIPRPTGCPAALITVCAGTWLLGKVLSLY